MTYMRKNCVQKTWEMVWRKCASGLGDFGSLVNWTPKRQHLLCSLTDLIKCPVKSHGVSPRILGRVSGTWIRDCGPPRPRRAGCRAHGAGPCKWEAAWPLQNHPGGTGLVSAKFSLSSVRDQKEVPDWNVVVAAWPRDICIRRNMATGPWQDLKDLISSNDGRIETPEGIAVDSKLFLDFRDSIANKMANGRCAWAETSGLACFLWPCLLLPALSLASRCSRGV